MLTQSGLGLFTAGTDRTETMECSGTRNLLVLSSFVPSPNRFLQLAAEGFGLRWFLVFFVGRRGRRSCRWDRKLHPLLDNRAIESPPVAHSKAWNPSLAQQSMNRRRMQSQTL
jgi:hypothetical protein